MATFSWKGIYGARKSVEPQIKVIKFGDGYEQRQGQGINRQPRSYQLEFPYPTAIADQIDAFLQARGAVESFTYAHPGETAGRFVCRSWERVSTTYGHDTIHATFDEVYE